MPNLNKVQLMGNLTREPELKYTTSGTAICAFGMAINRTYTAKDGGEKKQEVTFVDIEFWSGSAETIAKYVRKGDPLYIEGRLKLDTWDDKATGQKRSKLRVVGENFQFLKGKSDSTGGEEHEERQPAPRSQKKAPASSDNELPMGEEEDDVPF